MSKRYPLDEVFRRKLRDLDAGPPMHLWEKISQKRDWKHRVLNQARQKMPVAGLFATLLVVGLCWGVWSFQQPNLGSFPIPLSGAIAQMDAAEKSSSTATLSEKIELEKPATTTSRLSGSLALSPVAVVAIKNTATSQASQLAIAASGVTARQHAASMSPTPQQHPASYPPTVSPVREETLLANLPSILERETAKGGSVFEGLFSPDPKCANFGNGSWRVYIDALLSPDLTFRQLQPRGPEFEAYVSTREETESNMYAFSGALRLSLVSDKGLALRTGLNYSQINERFSYISGSEEVIETINNYDQNGNIISTDTIITVGTRRKITHNHYRMLDIPFLLGYELSSNKFNISINGGAYLNLLFRQKGDFLSPHDLQPVRFDSSDPNAYPAFKQQAGLGWYGSIGLAFQAGPNLQLVVEPHFKVYPKSVTRDQYGVQQRYMTTGLFVGVRQQL